MRESLLRRCAAASIGGVLVIGLAACGSSQGSGSGANESKAKSADCSAYKQFGDLKGKKVNIYSSWIDEEGQATDKSFDTFRQCTGATVQHEGSRDLAVQLPVRVKAGAAPDIAVAPQPGLLKTMVQTGKVQKLPQKAIDNIDKWFTKDWKE